MNRSLRYRSLLRVVLSSILSSKLSSNELKVLSDELRRGRFTDELAYMLDQVNNHIGAEDDEGADENTVLDVERLVKRRKITRSALASIIQSLGGNAAPSATNIRSLIRNFISEASPSMIRKLMDVLESSSEGDAFLAGIAGSRR